MNGEKTAFLSVVPEFPMLIAAVDGLQPSGAVAPKQVSRTKALLEVGGFPLLTAGCDSKTTKRASSVIEGVRFTPAKGEPSVEYEILRAEGAQPAVESMPRQVSASTIAAAGEACIAADSPQASNATNRPSAEITGRPL